MSWQWVNGPYGSGRKRHGALEIAPLPVHPNDRPADRKRPVLEIERRPRAFQKRLGNEEAEPEAAGFMTARIGVRSLALAPAAGDIRFADPLHDLGSKAGTVVGNDDGNLLPAPGGGDLDPLVREIDGVL